MAGSRELCSLPTGSHVLDQPVLSVGRACGLLPTRRNSKSDRHHLCDVTQVGTGLLLLSADLWREPCECAHRSFPRLVSAETSALALTLAAARRDLGRQAQQGCACPHCRALSLQLHCHLLLIKRKQML